MKKLDTSRYSLDGGSTTKSFKLNGTIDSEMWKAADNGTVTLTFFTNDSAGNIATEAVTIRKDKIAPDITVVKPVDNQVFGKVSPKCIYCK